MVPLFHRSYKNFSSFLFLLLLSSSTGWMQQYHGQEKAPFLKDNKNYIQLRRLQEATQKIIFNNPAKSAPALLLVTAIIFLPLIFRGSRAMKLIAFYVCLIGLIYFIDRYTSFIQHFRQHGIESYFIAYFILLLSVGIFGKVYGNYWDKSNDQQIISDNDDKQKKLKRVNSFSKKSKNSSNINNNTTTTKSSDLINNNNKSLSKKTKVLDYDDQSIISNNSDTIVPCKTNEAKKNQKNTFKPTPGDKTDTSFSLLIFDIQVLYSNIDFKNMTVKSAFGRKQKQQIINLCKKHYLEYFPSSNNDPFKQWKKWKEDLEVQCKNSSAIHQKIMNVYIDCLKHIIAIDQKIRNICTDNNNNNNKCSILQICCEQELYNTSIFYLDIIPLLIKKNTSLNNKKRVTSRLMEFVKEISLLYPSVYGKINVYGRKKSYNIKDAKSATLICLLRKNNQPKAISYAWFVLGMICHQYNNNKNKELILLLKELQKEIREKLDSSDLPVKIFIF